MDGFADNVADSAITGTRVELQVLTTLKCNLRCSYCSLAVGEVLGSQSRPRYSIDQLTAFIERHLPGKEVYFTLYGGEPTLNSRFALQLMERFPRSRFNLQTNGTLLHRVPERVLQRLSNINVSIDGGETITDAYRGEGVYRKVLKNVAAVRSKVPGTFTARMTWWSGDTTFEEIDALTGAFDYVYFQFAQDAAANSAVSVRKKKKVLSQLVDKFFSSNTFYPVVPIMGAVRNMVAPWRLRELTAGMTQCRVSTNLLNIMPDGKIFPCPDMMYASELLQGDVVENWVRRSPLQPQPAMPCRSCSAYAYCRGNCMKNMYLAYVRNDAQWRATVTEPICDAIRFMGEEIDRHEPGEWYARAPLPLRERLMNAEVYEFCEVMP
ncbi:MAG TPA: radical SAM protein [Burkholderiales bacterium]|nr:radical SAM protein [Burkholderiales bacterium]